MCSNVTFLTLQVHFLEDMTGDDQGSLNPVQELYKVLG